MAEPRKQGNPGVLETLAALASTALMAWMVTPPQERLWIKLSVLRRLHRTAGRAAFRAGHRGMGDELAERDFQRYEIAYWLSRARDELASTLEGMKP